MNIEEINAAKNLLNEINWGNDDNFDADKQEENSLADVPTPELGSDDTYGIPVDAKWENGYPAEWLPPFMYADDYDMTTFSD